MHRWLDLATGRAGIEPSQVPADLELSETRLVNTFGPEYRMLIIGAGQMSEYLATMAQFCGFDVTVCDHRTEYASVWNVHTDRKSTRLNSSHYCATRMPSSA